MREDVSETRKILEKHEPSMTTGWLDTVQVFKLRSIVSKAGFEKGPDYREAEIITLMMRLSFLLLSIAGTPATFNGRPNMPRSKTCLRGPC